MLKRKINAALGGRYSVLGCVFCLSIGLAAPASASWLEGLSEVFSGSASVNNDAGNNETGNSEAGNSERGSPLTETDLTGAFKQALELGSRQVVTQLSAQDGFNRDPAVYIPLPEQLQTVKGWLGKVGMASLMDDLELKLNRAAEKATPQAQALFIQAIKEMSFDDVRRIYQGPDNAATRYFQAQMTPSLSAAMQPIVSASLREVGAIQRYDEMIGAYKDIPLVPDISADLTTHVVERGLKGIFHYLAEQEAAIRQDPVKQTTALLQHVFGAR